jgi:hypothetical protein
MRGLESGREAEHRVAAEGAQNLHNVPEGRGSGLITSYREEAPLTCALTPQRTLRGLRRSPTSD